MKKFFFVLIGIMICLFLTREIYSYWNQINLADLDFDYRRLIFLSVLLLSYYMLLPLIWIIMIKGIGQEVSLKKGLIIHIYSQSAKYLPGGMWNVLGRVYLCNKQGMNMVPVSTSILLEILLNLIAGFIIMLNVGYKLLSINFFVLLLLLMAIALFYMKPSLLLKPISGIYYKWKKQIVDINIPTKKLIQWTVYYLMAWIFYGIVFYLFITYMFDIKISLFFSVYVLIASWIVGFLSPIPGGLGVREGSMTYLLSTELPYSEALLISLFSRFWILTVEVALYLTTYIVAKKAKVSVLNRRTEADKLS